MRELEKYREAIANRPQKYREVDVMAEKEDRLRMEFLGETRKGAGYSVKTEYYVRVTGEKTGFVYTQDGEEEPLEVFEKAYQNSQYAQEGEIQPFGAGRKEPLKEELQHLEAAVMEKRGRALAGEIENAVEELEELRIELTERIRTQGVVNSRGLDVTFANRLYQIEVFPIFKNESGDCAGLRFSFPEFEDITADGVIEELKRMLKNRAPQILLTGGVYPAVLDRRVVKNIMTTAWQIFSGVRYESGATMLAGKLGKKVGSKQLSVTDFPQCGYTGFASAFDCEGTRTETVELIQEGVLTGLLDHLASGAKSGRKPKGSAGRKALFSGNIHTEIQITPRNICILPGEKSLEELLDTLKDGLYITDSYDEFHSINIGSGEYAIPCNAMVIKDGKRVGTANAITMNGSLSDLFENIEAVGNDVYVELFEMLEGYCYGGPSILVSALNVSGN